MNNSYYMNNRARTIKAIVVFILIFALLAGAIGGIIALTRNNQGDDLQIAEQENNYKAGAFVSESTVKGAALMVSAFSADSLSVGDETIAKGSTASVSVTYTPSYLTNVKFDYSLAFENPSSAWASGKRVSDYMTFTPSSDGAITGTLTCKKAFGEPIILTATSRDGNSVSGSCTLGYIARPTINDVTFCPSDFGDSAELEVNYSLGDGTHEGVFNATAYVSVNSDFIDDVKSQVSFNIQITSCAFTTFYDYDDEYFYIQYGDGAEMTWDLFISNFNSLTSSQKAQLYYAWYQTWHNDYRSTDFILVDYQIEYSYNGETILSEAESDLPIGYLTGEVNGSSVELSNVNVNGGGTILF